jgi:zinc transporter ZupT
MTTHHLLGSNRYTLSFLVGMVAANFAIHLLPEAFGDSDISPWLVSIALIGGVALQYSLHRYLSPTKKTGNQFLLFLHIHNVTDGLTIGLAFLAHVSLGIFTTVAIMIHDIVHKIIGFGFLRSAGDSVRKAFLKIMTTFISILVGLLLMLVFRPDHEFSVIGGGFAAGSLAYVVMLLLKEVFGKKAIVPRRYETLLKSAFFGLGGVVMVVIILLLQAYGPESSH